MQLDPRRHRCACRGTFTVTPGDAGTAVVACTACDGFCHDFARVVSPTIDAPERHGRCALCA